MEMEMKKNASGMSIAYVTATLLLISLLIKAVNVLWLKPKKLERHLRKQGFSGSHYKPLVGDALEVLKLSKDAYSKPISLSDDTLPRVLPFVMHILNKHGNNSFGWVATTPWLIVTDVEKIKEILIKYDDFRKPNHEATKMLILGLTSLEGEHWAKHRKIINPAFHLDKLKTMLPAMYLSCKNMTDLWAEKVSDQGSTEMDVLPYLENLSADVISRAAFGSSYEEAHKIFYLQREHFTLATEMLQYNYIPGYRYLPTHKNRKMKAVTKEIRALLMEMIEKRKTEVEKGSNSKNDLLGILLESNMREMQGHGNLKGRGLTSEEVVDECKLFYLAGSETTSSLLAWSLFLLSLHQDWQERARSEILQVFGKDENPHFDGLNHLKVVTMILNETLRLYSPGYMILRKVFKDTKLGEWLIPTGTEIVIPCSSLHQDFEVWGDDAKEFNPARFAQGVSNAMKGNGVFIPFSAGPRICIGQNFAILEAKIALTSILRLFSLHISPTYVHAPQAFISVKPQHGVNLILQKLSLK